MYFKRIGDLRQDNDLTQETLAKKLNISQRAYSYYESGERDIPIDILIELADFYQTTIDYIVGRIDKY